MLKWIPRIIILGGLVFLVVQLPKILNMGLNAYLEHGKLNIVILFGIAGLALVGFLVANR
jgi:hypothetical protein